MSLIQIGINNTLIVSSDKISEEKAQEIWDKYDKDICLENPFEEPAQYPYKKGML